MKTWLSPAHAANESARFRVSVAREVSDQKVWPLNGTKISIVQRGLWQTPISIVQEAIIPASLVHPSWDSR
jgi:hypothetical protein